MPDVSELYIGLEIDYLNESNPSIARFRELPLDYRIRFCTSSDTMTKGSGGCRCTLADTF